MGQTIEHIEPTYAYDALTYSFAIVDVQSLSVVFSEAADPQPFTTTTIGFFTRDPIGFEGSEWGLYEFLSGKAVFSVDPSGNSVCDGYDDFDDPFPCYKQSFCWMRFPGLPYLPWPEEDKYPSLAKKCCQAFERLYGGGNGYFPLMLPAVQCVADCLITHEENCQKPVGCDDRQRCRSLAHVDCYAKCKFVPYLGMPWDCRAITGEVLNW